MSSKLRLEKRQLSEQPSFMITSLPDDIIFDIVARVPRWDYPMLSLVSKHFKSLVASPELYARRSLLGCTEACLYAVLRNRKTGEKRLYILGPKDKGKSKNHLVRIQSLQVMPYYNASFVSVGSKIYVFGNSTSVALSIDCRSHKVQSLPSMPMPLDNTVADYMDRKIYVIGYCFRDAEKIKYKINTDTQMWEPEILGKELVFLGYGCVVMEDKIYIRNHYNSFVYRPKENKWEKDEMLHSKNWRNACVIDDLLCYYDSSEKELRAYDTKQRLWRVVKGVAQVFPDAVCSDAYTVSYGGKLVLFLRVCDISSRNRQIWCAEIATKRLGGEIWGKVERCDVVFEENEILIKPLVVMV